MSRCVDTLLVSWAHKLLDLNEADIAASVLCEAGKLLLRPGRIPSGGFARRSRAVAEARRRVDQTRKRTAAVAPAATCVGSAPAP